MDTPGITVAALYTLLGIDVWEASSFRADIRIDFNVQGYILKATLLNPKDNNES